MAHKHRKTRKMRGTRTHGYGNTQKHRGAGSRGGRGMAGSKKHKWTYVSKYLPNYFGRSGFKRPKAQVKETKAINIGYIDENFDRLVESGLIKKGKDSNSINLTEQGFDKLLGAGKVSRKYSITVSQCSGKAKEKVESAQGQVILPEGAKSSEESEGAAEAQEK
jgi:large subunit ribosomal protein L15